MVGRSFSTSFINVGGFNLRSNFILLSFISPDQTPFPSSPHLLLISPTFPPFILSAFSLSANYLPVSLSHFAVP